MVRNRQNLSESSYSGRQRGQLYSYIGLRWERGSCFKNFSKHISHGFTLCALPRILEGRFLPQGLGTSVLNGARAKVCSEWPKVLVRWDFLHLQVNFINLTYISYSKSLLLSSSFTPLSLVPVLLSDCCDPREPWELNRLSEVWEPFFTTSSREGGSTGWRSFWKACIEELEGNAETSCYLI